MPTCCQALAGSFPRPEWGVQGTRDHWDTLLLGKHSTGKHGGHALDCTPPPVPPRPCLSVGLHQKPRAACPASPAEATASCSPLQPRYVLESPAPRGILAGRLGSRLKPQGPMCMAGGLGL